MYVTMASEAKNGDVLGKNVFLLDRTDQIIELQTIIQDRLVVQTKLIS